MPTTDVTTTWTVLPAPAAGSARAPQAWALRGAAAVSAACEVEMHGYADCAWTAPQLVARLAEQSWAERLCLVAVPAGREGDERAVAGHALVTLPARANTDVVDVQVAVHPRERRRGAGTALLATATDLAVRRGRTVVLTDSEHAGEPPAGSPVAVTPPTGAGRVDSTSPGAAFAAAHGFTLEQAERYSRLDLPVDPVLLDRLAAQARSAAGEAYRVVRWRDRAPDGLVDAFAALETAMTTQAPQGDLALAEDPWDAARVRAWETQVRDGGNGLLVAAAEHAATGALVGMTVLAHPLDPASPAVFQEDTIVLPDHRGHRLGMLLKTDLLAWLAAVRPQARRVHTWNAEENAHMLGINVALGFRPRGVAAVWRRRLESGTGR